MIGIRVLTAALALPLLSGCVAAAVPVLAAGGLIKAQSDAGDAPADIRPRVAIPADPVAPGDAGNAAVGPVEGPVGPTPGAIVRDYAFEDGTRVTVTNSTGLAPARQPLADAPQDTPQATPLADMTSLPIPSVEVPTASATITSASGYSDFTSFAREQALVPVAGAERMSALLVNSGQLSPETRACSIHPAAVMIDIDPSGDTLDPTLALKADPALAASLAALRSDGVEIGWVSGRTADQAGAIRKALSTAGLDPEGRDQLVLLRFPEERKQTRREDFGKENCVLAIAGDERADFDELFSYLRDPDAPTPLDVLIGKRWFVVPPPLD